MRQLVHDFRTGELRVDEVPLPILRGEGILVNNLFSLVSTGTERTTVTTARRSLVGKALARPDLVRQVVDAAKKYGIVQTYGLVMSKLSSPIPLGYSCAGIVGESNCSEFSPGDRVAGAGAGYASHAEVVYIPKNLAAKVPEGLDLAHAAFTTVGAIALQGIRQAELTLGEKVLVIGLGLIGQLTVQLLRAHGCWVFGVDLDARAADLALTLGANGVAVRSSFEVERCVSFFTGGLGFDAVIITAATDDNDPINIAGHALREKGRVVILGAVKADVPREPFYSKELDVRFSRSHGPGRYDRLYEEKGIDYPYGYVRWTEKRNMEAFLDLVADRKVLVDPLISHRFRLDQAPKAYDLILGGKDERSLGLLFEYDRQPDTCRRERIIVGPPHSPPAKKKLGIGFIGAGNFARHFLLPQVAKVGNVSPIGVVTATGINSRNVARKYGFAFCSTDAADLFKSDEIDAVFIVTRHDLHARFATDALRAKKHVFVEKPLALTEEELERVLDAASHAVGYLAVGFNRRFSPLIQDLKLFLSKQVRSPLMMTYRINAEPLAADHWVQDPMVGGGRIVGEVCHFVDTLMFLTQGHCPVRVFSRALPTSGVRNLPDSLAITLDFADGSIGQIAYTTAGERSFPKERIEIFGGGVAAVLDDFKRLRIFYGGRCVKRIRKWVQEKGYREEVHSFINVVSGREKRAFRLDQLAAVTRTTFKIQESIATGRPVNL